MEFHPKIKQKNVYIFFKASGTWSVTSFLTTVSSAKAVGEPDDVSIVSPGRHINEVVR